jgi:hypothetical protein
MHHAAVLYRSAGDAADSEGACRRIEVARGPLVFLAHAIRAASKAETQGLIIHCGNEWIDLSAADKLVIRWFGTPLPQG